MDNQENKQNDDDKKGKGKDKQEKEKFGTKGNNNSPENINDGDNKNESFTAPYDLASKHGLNNNNNEDKVDKGFTSTTSAGQSSAKNPKKSKFQQSQENVSETNNEDNVVNSGVTSTSSTRKNDQSSAKNPNFQRSQENVSKTNNEDNVVNSEVTSTSSTRENDQSSKKSKFQQSQENVSETNNEDNADNSEIASTSPAGNNDQSYNNPEKSEKQNYKGKSINDGSMTNETNERKDFEKGKTNLYETTENEENSDTKLSKSQRRRLKKKQTENAANNSTGQRASTSQNNEESASTTQDQSQNQQSSSITGGISSIINTAKNTAKSFMRTEEEPDDDKHIKIQFHVHLPASMSGNGEPIVIGSIPELGGWNEPKVKLRQFKRNFQSTTYWCSEPIRIPIERFQNAVKYKYAIFIKKGNKKNKNPQPFQYEGNDEKDDRVLEMCKNQFDIWMKNNKNNQYDRINDYMFLEIIYNSVNQNNFKDAILEYDKVLKNNRELMRSVTNFEFVNRRKQEKSIHKRLFLCFLLGHCSSNSNFVGKSELPSHFLPGSLLEVIKEIRPDTFPSNCLRNVLKGIELLIHRDIDRRSFEWLNIFQIAHCIDPKYNFIDSISFNYDVNYTENFFEKLDMVIPYIDTIDNKGVYAKVAKVFLITRLFLIMFSSINPFLKYELFSG
jgi:hypothetical protein